MNQEKDLLSAVRENVRIHSARKKAVGMAKKKQNWCRGPESNWLRPPFQGGALPMSYPGFTELFNFRDDSQHCQFGLWDGTESAQVLAGLFSPLRSIPDTVVRWTR